MALTPISGKSSFCTPEQFLRRFDFRTVGHLLADDGKRLTYDQVLASETLADLLEEASGEFEAALYRGGRYTAADLGALTDNGLEWVAGLVGGYAMWLIWERRPDRHDIMELPRRAQMSLEKMQDLATGHRILPFQEAADAGRVHHEVEPATVVIRRQLAPVIAGRFFGIRGNEMFPSPPPASPHF